MYRDPEIEELNTMKKDVTTKEVNEKMSLLSSQVKDMFDKFEKETGVYIDNVSIERVYTLGCPDEILTVRLDAKFRAY